MVVFQFVADQGRWVYINPPLTQRNLTPTIFKSQKLHEKSEFKIYSLQGIGPKYQRSTDGQNFQTFQEVNELTGVKCSDVHQFLRLPKWKGTTEILDKFEMLTTGSSKEEREAYLLKNLKFVDNWLRLER